MFVKEVWMTMKKLLFSGLVVVGLTSASAWARVDPFAVVPVAPIRPVVTVPVTSTTATTAIMTRPVVVIPIRPPLISPIR
jgi:hypothetical protein